MSDADQPVFAAELVPHRSLGPKGYRIFMAIAAALTLAHIAFFAITGAWPVVFFFGLDFLLVYGAFRLSYRSARAREEVRLSRTDLSIRKVSPGGAVREMRFNPFFARFRVKRHSEIGITHMYVTGQGRVTDIGSFLNPDDRETFASAMIRALATVKQRI